MLASWHDESYQPIRIARRDWHLVAIEGKATLDPAGSYTVAAIGGANDWDLAILPLADETTPAIAVNDDGTKVLSLGQTAPSSRQRANHL